ncbi:proliferating cell nuclear antigen [Anaeramoeba flamelloides]|uniref:DNA sliding clamp PCNA n=1 Tax=Anaeramoeba flamelloides TaxID=1746091 RepID=A0AAV7YUE2_9EUKA|nr:proliferating cell nuclear antigen [Anaeramoeba flamelloides]KAJ6233812.1 proliferating cell nuclear antigen [Anaeramoeba flamelloides]
MEAKFTKASTLKKLIEAVKELIDECNLECSSTGITMQAMDSSHISLVSFELLAEGFEEYQCNQNISIGINLGTLSKILKSASSDDSIRIFTDENIESITFEFINNEKSIKSTYEIKLIDITGDPVGIPETEYSVTVSMASTEFSKICKDLGVMGETVKVEQKDKKVIFSTSGELGTGSIEINEGENIDESTTTKIESNENIELSFALRYLTLFSKAAPLCENVSLSLELNVPLVVEFPIGENGCLGSIKYFLAPKMGDEDEEDADEEEEMGEWND